MPIYHSTSEEIADAIIDKCYFKVLYTRLHTYGVLIGDAIIDNVISKYCIPDYILMDQDSAFMSMLMNYLFKKMNIKIRTVALYNHQSLQAEHGIKSLSIILTKHLTEQGQT